MDSSGDISALLAEVENQTSILSSILETSGVLVENQEKQFQIMIQGEMTILAVLGFFFGFLLICCIARAILKQEGA